VAPPAPSAIAITPFGDGALRLALPPGVAPRGAFDALRALAGVTDVVVTERHACVYFDPATPPADLAVVVARLREAPASSAAQGPLVTVRARYDGPDLARVAAHAGLTPDAVVAIHTAREYTVRVVGFLPGFAYLGELDPRIAVARLASPRARVPAGAIGIAGARTGVYPSASPGGWNLVGTAVDFVAFRPDVGATLALGDRVRFEAV
jgi:UPF0271 protein